MVEAEDSTAHDRVKRPRLVLLWAIAGVLAIGVLLLWLSLGTGSIPSAGGHDAEYWLAHVFRSSIPRTTSAKVTNSSQLEAIQAFRTMGPAGVEYLVDALGRSENPWYKFKTNLYPRLPIEVRKHLSTPVPADLLVSAASLMLINIRDEDPQKSFPRLVRLLSSNDPRTRLHAASLVSNYAERYRSLDIAQHEKALRRALHDSNYWIRVHAVVTLDVAGLAGPDMIRVLRPAATTDNAILDATAVNLIHQMETNTATAH